MCHFRVTPKQSKEPLFDLEQHDARAADDSFYSHAAFMGLKRQSRIWIEERGNPMKSNKGSFWCQKRKQVTA